MRSSFSESSIELVSPVEAQTRRTFSSSRTTAFNKARKGCGFAKHDWLRRVANIQNSQAGAFADVDFAIFDKAYIGGATHLPKQAHVAHRVILPEIRVNKAALI